MIVTAALAWWNERPEDLIRCVTATRNIADRIVALDGAYARFPGAQATSSDDQVSAIQTAAMEAGIECLVLQPNRVWAGQVEKRSYLMNMAAVGSDWVVPVDTDHIIHGNRDRARRVLERSHGPEVYDAYLYTPRNDARPIEESAAGNWHANLSGRRTAFAHIFKANPGFQVEKFHWWISAIVRGKRQWMWGGDSSYPQVHHAEFPLEGYYIEHLSLYRDREQVLANRGFCNDREMIVALTGQEDWRPGLPEPQYDFDRLGA